ncbi:MAG: ferrous iron transport protein A [Deltaproteobacteria bacterium]|nr:ferrous iron transport protein A [Deltaproteobacteria bacterium]MBW1794566.1 ferrous iron transport protein A [Deltaproteobacteria bacterium]
MNLSELRTGQTASVTRVGGDGPFRRRLLEMGFLTGTDVYVEKYAPLRDPIELILKGYHVSLRVDEAARIQVENVREVKTAHA